MGESGCGGAGDGDSVVDVCGESEVEIAGALVEDVTIGAGPDGGHEDVDIVEVEEGRVVGGWRYAGDATLESQELGEVLGEKSQVRPVVGTVDLRLEVSERRFLDYREVNFCSGDHRFQWGRGIIGIGEKDDMLVVRKEQRMELPFEVVADVEEGCDVLALLLVDGREKSIIAFHI